MLASLRLRPLIALACLAVAPAARAQVAYTEPPDLSPSLADPSPVGTVAPGQNTVTGTLSGVWGTSGTPGGDDADSFSFVVPPGLMVSDIQIVVSNFTCTNCRARARSFSSGVGEVELSGNGTFTLPVWRILGPGTYNAQAYVGQRPSGVAGSSSFTYQFRITMIPATNDLCQFATPITLGATPFNNSTATTDGLPHPAACTFFTNPGIDRDLWYTFTPAQSGLLTVSTCGSTFDTEVNVYSGTACPATDAALLACNDDSAACGSGTFQSQLVITANAGQTYLIRVGSYDGTADLFGAGTLTLSQITTGACCNRWTGHCTVRAPLDCTSQGLRFDGFGLTCSPATCIACPADFNGLDGRTLQDLFDYLNAWFAGC